VAFLAVLDACVLYPASLQDILLRCAEAEFFDVVWSERILDEVARNLVADARATPARARRLVGLMSQTFPEAAADTDEIARLEPTMGCDPDDNHVAAAAIAGGADVIVTLNVGDFPPAALAPWGITVVPPDDLLCEFLDAAPDRVVSILRQQSAALSRPPITVEHLVDLLAATVPRLAAQARSKL